MGTTCAFDPQFEQKSLSLIYPGLKTPTCIQDHTENGLQEFFVCAQPLPTDSV